MEHIIVGTAGHVDHGKTELTLALTGINTDRLPEEKKRGMTIELGFVPLVLDDGRRLGLIDVPGHERFVKNMLAGAAGIDMFMLIIAADEGIMPQTVEHLHILHLLGIEKGLIVITKKDLVDQEWLSLIEEEISNLVQDTSLAGASMIAVSALTGEGIADLKAELAAIAAQVKPKTRSGHFRLPIDRVFSKTGFGTVITGTLWQGKIAIGDEIDIWPGGEKARVRGLQVHGAKVDAAFAGQRTAVNVAGQAVDDLPKGGWLAHPNLLQETYRLDIELSLLAQANPLKQRSRLRVHHGTKEVLARLQLLDREELEPKQTCFAQLLLESPLPVLRGDRLILRSYSPAITVAGAAIIDANPERHKRHNAVVIDSLRRKAKAAADDIVADILVKEQAIATINTLAKWLKQPKEELELIIAAMMDIGKLVIFEIDGQSHYGEPDLLKGWQDNLLAALTKYHQDYPLRSGLALATAHKQFFKKLTQKQLMVILDKWQQEGLIKIDNSWLSLADFAVKPSPAQAALIEKIESIYQENLFAPPDLEQVMADLKVSADLKAELQIYLADRDILLHIGDNLWFYKQALAKAEQLLRNQSAADGFSLAEARDALNSSRKYVLAILEYFDNRKITVRVGENRQFKG